MKKTLVIGASEHPERYSYKAVKMLRDFDHEVKALGVRDGVIGDVEIETVAPQDQDFDTVTMYLNPTRQKDVEDYILSLKPKRIIFNPGTENIEFEKKAASQGIDVVEACTLVMLRSHQY
ncbi:MAG: CoA-binding protein [Chitinophagales bacterium]|nr:CoA-binding protein [Chitinophagales bacterium]MCZ2393319.1 CoA-binding protein [Chitinophagales bacterium]